ncbi:MAG: phage tail sheath C-terminal domain-containing protein [Sphingomonas sp.]
MSANVPTPPAIKDRKTPGVYITELEAFPTSIVGVATAVPIFIGYTETAIDPSSGKPIYLQQVALSSMADYRTYFGAAFDTGIVAAAVSSSECDFEASSWDGSSNPPVSEGYTVATSVTPAGTMTYVPLFNLYAAMELFFANGGGSCFVISVANYWGTTSTTPLTDAAPVAVNASDLMAGLVVSNDIRGGTMLVVPDACLLAQADAKGALSYPGYQSVVVEMLRQSGTLQDRMAILDMPGALVPANWSADAMEEEANAFYTAIAPAAPWFSYGATYGPALQSSLLANTDLTYSNLSGSVASVTLMNNLLTTQALSLYATGIAGQQTQITFPSNFTDVAAHIAAAFPVAGAAPLASDPANVVGVTQNLAVSLNGAVAVPTDSKDIKALEQYLLNALPLLANIQQILADRLNVVPPSGAIAGAWALNDTDRGVWNAPANMALNQILSPKVLLNDAQQGDYNMPLNGNAIDILRDFTNRGTVIWGARTLDGNSNDYRYIQVRRTLIYLDQSIKQGLEAFTFAANDGSTWVAVTAMISGFLTQLWQAGGLMGDKASDAFTVLCGLGSTMTGEDILNGEMVVSVTLQMIRPAEFIELSFTQTMQSA